MTKPLKRFLTILLLLGLAGGFFPLFPNFSSYAGDVSEHTVFYTSFENGKMSGETYHGYPLRCHYDDTRSENVSSTNSNDWMMSMVESASANTPLPDVKTADNLTDNNPNTSYRTNTPFPVVVKYDLYEPILLSCYSVSSTNNYNADAPMDWTIEGSNDKRGWTVVDTQKGHSFSRRSQKKRFYVENCGEYKYYRMVITKKAGGAESGIVQFSDLIFYEWNVTASNLQSGALGTKVVRGGPASTYTGQANSPWKGENSLKVTAVHLGNGRGYSNAYLYENMNILVTANTYLRYVVFPDFEVKEKIPEDAYDYEYTNQYVALDIRFTDGTYMSDLGAVDQNGHGMSARAGRNEVAFRAKLEYD